MYHIQKLKKKKKRKRKFPSNYRPEQADYKRFCSFFRLSHGKLECQAKQITNLEMGGCSRVFRKTTECVFSLLYVKYNDNSLEIHV